MRFSCISNGCQPELVELCVGCSDPIEGQIVVSSAKCSETKASVNSTSKG